MRPNEPWSNHFYLEHTTFPIQTFQSNSRDRLLRWRFEKKMSSSNLFARKKCKTHPFLTISNISSTLIIISVPSEQHNMLQSFSSVGDVSSSVWLLSSATILQLAVKGKAHTPSETNNSGTILFHFLFAKQIHTYFCGLPLDSGTPLSSAFWGCFPTPRYIKMLEPVTQKKNVFKNWNRKLNDKFDRIWIAVVQQRENRFVAMHKYICQWNVIRFSNKNENFFMIFT